MGEAMLLGVLRMPLPDTPSEVEPLLWVQIRVRMRDAADEIDRLAAENAELTTERDAALEWAERYEQVVAERDRLREALEKVLRRATVHPDDDARDDRRNLRHVEAIARAALSKGER